MDNHNYIYSQYTWVYVLGPALGGVIAGLVYKIHEKIVGQMVKEAQEEARANAYKVKQELDVAHKRTESK